jgi:type IV pilus assembly protein PilW
VKRDSRSRFPATGFTLVEMMVAMTLGLLLMLVISQIFLGSKEAYNSIEEVSRLQENARFAIGQLGRVVRMAAYTTDPLDIVNRATIFPPLAPALDAADGGGSASDQITVRYQGSGTPAADGTVLDCQGNQIKGGALAVNKYYLANGVNGRTSLFCDNTGTIGPVTAAVELVPNVENMQVLFGEDITVPSDFAADRYVTKASVTNMNNVVSVRIALLLTTNDFIATAVDSNTYTLLDATYDPVDDRRVRRVYTTTIALRNRAP